MTNKIINDISGMIILNKPKGITSNDCLTSIKKILHPKKIGHTGTLDKNATGVLICLLGNATKSQDYLMMNCIKTYKAELIFGISTDTDDFLGNIEDIDLEKINSINNEKIEKDIKSFIGDYEQVPPMYSSKKVGGRKLLDMARNGITIERKPESLKIYDIKVDKLIDYKYNDFNLKCIDILVSCSKGTYIRTLCKDIGKKIGIPACMGNLCRIESGEFKISESISLDELKEKVNYNDLSFIKPCFYSNDKTALTFGKFETLHIGHLKIINEVIEYSKKHKLKSTIMIVGNNTYNDILTKEQRISKLKLLGVDNILYYPLDEINKNVTPSNFIREILYKQLKTEYLVVGTDCSFGKDGIGDVSLLSELCRNLNINYKIIEKLKVKNTNIDISSTYIKNEFENGNFDLVNSLLGR